MFPEKPEHHPISLVFTARSVTVGGKEEKEGRGAGRSTEANEWGMKTQFPLLRPGGEVLVETPLPFPETSGSVLEKHRAWRSQGAGPRPQGRQGQPPTPPSLSRRDLQARKEGTASLLPMT